MNAEPAPNPEDIKGQLPPVNNDPLPDFSVPANPNADTALPAVMRYSSSN